MVTFVSKPGPVVTESRPRKEQYIAASLRLIPQLWGVKMETRDVMKAKPAPSQPAGVLRPPSHKAILTSKELNVLELVSYGYDNRAIADYFQTTRQAVKNMMRVIHLKLGADNRAHAVAVCFRNGWFSGTRNGGPGSGGSAGRGPMFDEPGTQVDKLYGLSAPRRRDGRGPVQSAKFRP
jgi:DNA-binding CsgD family transcriptional regulator